MSQFRKHYAKNRKRLREQRVAKFTRMRAANERLRIERENAEPVTPDCQHIKSPRRAKAHVEIRVRVADKWFCLSAHQAPWGGIMPSATELLRFTRDTLLLA